MAYSVHFPEANAVLAKPEGMTDDQCNALPILRQNNQCISVWKFTPEEMVSVNLTNQVVIGLLSGQTQPPMWVQAAATAEAGDLPDEQSLQMNDVHELGTLGVRVFIFSDEMDEIEKARGQKLRACIAEAIRVCQDSEA